MDEPFPDGLDVTVEKGRVCRNAHCVSCAMNIHPSLCPDFLVEEKSPHAFGEHLSPSAGHCSQAGLLQLTQHFVNGHPEFLRKEVDLNRRVCLHVDAGKFLFDLPYHPEIVVPSEMCGHPPGNMDFLKSRLEF